MFFDAIKRFFGLPGSEPPLSPGNDNQPNYSVRINDQLVPYSPMSPDINEMESDIAQIHKFMEQQMRSMMGSFGFTFGAQIPGFGFEDDSLFRSFPFSPGMGGIPGNPNESPVPKAAPPALDPRDEMLKPKFRSRSSENWNGQDENLDERLNNEGLGSVIQDLRPSDEVYGRNNNLFGGFPSLFGSGIFGQDPFNSGMFGNIGEPHTESSMSSSMVTIYSNVNGQKSVEKIIRRPDGTIERTVIKDDGNPSLPQ